MATCDVVVGAATSTVRDRLTVCDRFAVRDRIGVVGREFVIVVGIAFAGVTLAAAVALAPWPVLDDTPREHSAPVVDVPARAGQEDPR